MKRHYPNSVQRAQLSYENSLTKCVTQQDSTYYGGVVNPHLMADIITATGNISNAACLYVCKDSIYHKDEKVLDHILAWSSFTLRKSHEDGTTDMIQSNFFTPATFEINQFVKGYRSFEKYISEFNTKEKKTLEAMKEVLASLANGLLNGGFHTPNHRWVESAALLNCYNILGWDALKKKADLYLAEGIDIDEYGEYTERSPGMYNEVNDRALFIIAKESGNEMYFEPIKKNLKLLYHYIDPDESIFTQNSRRKDKGEVSINTRFYPTAYYSLLLQCAYEWQDLSYAAFADKILEDAKKQGRPLPGDLGTFLLTPELQTWEPDIKDIEHPVCYDAYYPKSNIWRYRDGDVSFSLLADNPNFLFIKHKDIQIYARMCASFFAVAQFKPNKLEQTNDGYKMTFKAHGEYRLPFEQPPETTVWHEMDHTKRKTIQPVDLIFDLVVKKTKEGLLLDIHTRGCEQVPFKLEWVISPGHTIETNDVLTESIAGNHLCVKQGDIRIETPTGEEVVIKNLFTGHTYHKDMRGSLAQAMDGFTIYATDITPIDRKVEIVCQKRKQAHTHL